MAVNAYLYVDTVEGPSTSKTGAVRWRNHLSNQLAWLASGKFLSPLRLSSPEPCHQFEQTLDRVA